MKKGILLFILSIILITGCSKDSSKIDISKYFIRVNPADYGIDFTIESCDFAEEGYTDNASVIKATASITDEQKDEFKRALLENGYYVGDEDKDAVGVSFKSYYKVDGEEKARTQGCINYHFENGKVEFLYESTFGNIPNESDILCFY